MTRKRMDRVGASLTTDQSILIVQAVMRLLHVVQPVTARPRSQYQTHSEPYDECSGCDTLLSTITRDYGEVDDDD